MRMATACGVDADERTILVSGISRSTTDESLEMFFESPKRTGGGDIESCKYDKKEFTAVITFSKADDAHRVIQTAIRSGPLKLNGATLTVQRYTSRENKSGRTLTVTGFSSRTTKENIELYFENHKRSGGGEIDNCLYDDTQGKAQITFKNSEDAERVIKNTCLRLDGSLLTAKSGHLSSQPVSILASGFSQNTTEEIIRLFFENEKRSGGGDLANLTVGMRNGNPEALIDFVDPQVTDRVLARENFTLDEAEIRCRPFNQGTPFHQSSPAESTFSRSTPNIVRDESLLRSAPSTDAGHGKRLDDSAFNQSRSDSTVKRVQSTRNRPSTAHTRPEESSHYGVFSIEVNQLPKSAAEKTIRMFFESKKRSGGDKIDKIFLDMRNSRAVITYIDETVAKRVVDKFRGDPTKFKLEKIYIRVALMQPAALIQDPPAPLEPLKCLLFNVPIDIEPPEIKEFLRQASDNTIRNVLYSYEYPNMMVEFHHQPDYDALIKLCMTKPLRGRMIALVRLALPKYIQVHNIDQVDDELEMYFESKDDSGGGESLQNVEDCSGDHYAILQFDALSDVKGVLQKKHVLSGRTLTVSPFYPDFGIVPTFYKPTNTWLTPPEPITVDLDKPEVFDFLKTRLCQQKLTELGKKNLFHIDWTSSGRSSLHLCLEVDVNHDESRMIPQKAHPDVCNTVLTDLLNCIDSQSIAVMQSVYKDALMKIQDECQEASLVQGDGICTIAMVGFKNQIQHELVRAERIKEDLERIQSRKDATISISVPIKQYELKLMEMINLESFFPKDVKVDEDSYGLKLTGIRDEVMATRDIIKQHKNDIKVSENVHNPAFSALLHDNMDEMCQRMRSDGLMVIVDQQGPNLSMFAVDQNDIRKVKNLLSMEIAEITIPLQADKRQVAQSREWENFKHKMEKQYSGKLRISTEQTEISVACSPSIATTIEEAIESKLNLLSISNTFVPAHENIKQLLEEFHHQLLKNEEQKWKPSMVKITPGEENGRSGFIISAPSVDLHDVTKSLQLLFDRVVPYEYEIDKSNIARQLLTDHGQAFIKAQGVTNKVVCDVIAPQSGWSQKLRQPAPVVSKPSQTSRTLGGATASIPLPSGSYQAGPGKNCVVSKDGITVQLCIGSINDQTVEVIVNSTSNDLDLSVGAVSAVLLKAAGQALQDECKQKAPNGLQAGELLVTSAGNISGAKAVFHVVLPRWSGTSSLKVLSSLLKKILEDADKSGYSSLVFPTMGSGYLGYPHKDIARIMFDEISSYSKAHPNTKLKDIRIAIYDKDATSIKAFESEVIALTRTESAPIAGMVQGRNISLGGKKHANQGTLQQTCVTDQIFIGNISLCVKHGDLTKETADAIVNSTGPELKAVGAVCKAVMKDAAVKQECKNLGSIKHVAITTGGNLKCTNVIHLDATSGNWENHVYAVLDLAKQNGLKSVAFPAFGTGKLAIVPVSDMTRYMYNGIQQFEKSGPGSVTHIRIVAFESSVQQEFISKFMNIQPPSTHSQGPPATGDGNGGFKIGPLNLHVKKGDLTKESVDAIVNSTGPELYVVGAVSKTIIKEGGKSIQDECKDILKRDKRINRVAMTTGGNLKCSKVIHLDVTRGDWENHVYDALTLAKQQGLRSIAFPAFGTGKLAPVPIIDMTRYMYNGIRRFVDSGPGSVDIVNIVVFDAPVMGDFIQNISGMISQPSSSAGNLNPSSRKMEVTSTGLTIKMYALSADAIQKTKAKIDDYCKQISSNYVFDSGADVEKIRNLTQAQVMRIKHLESNYEVDIDIQQDAVNLIVVSGISDAVMKCVSQVNAILDEVNKVKIIEIEEAMLKKQVQWEYETPEGFEAYPDDINMIIEEAFQQKKTVIGWEEEVDGASYRIDFDRMEERQIGDERNEVKVRRMDKLSDDIKLPSHWDDMKGERLKCFLVPKQNKNGQPNPEYKTVEDHFKKTCNATIVRIERVQNADSIKSYEVHKTVMKQRNPSNIENERHLFHATSSPDKMDSINASWFTRSFAGEAAGCWYGKGVYFARDASLSIKYAKTPDDKSIYYMYRCKVLVGEFTKGKKDQSAPPAKPNSMLPYDSLVDDPQDPQEFVIFHDSAAYPEYIIAFKK